MSIVKNNNGTNSINAISLQTIPIAHAIRIGKKWYDKRELRKWFATGARTLPNTRAPVNNATVRQVMYIADPLLRSIERHKVLLKRYTLKKARSTNSTRSRQ